MKRKLKLASFSSYNNVFEKYVIQQYQYVVEKIDHLLPSQSLCYFYLKVKKADERYNYQFCYQGISLSTFPESTR